ncbi:helix-turn-helix domain-containing protein [Amycolatopsis kentuckyensis]|uniref:helix-turn-helix domain-containing protein n=1 Tax=Amycolatopsis kentuckyensis TaxID=218823 RepID=UPI0035661ACF
MDQALTGIGLRPGRMPCFASRSAAMCAVGPEVVAATFYNFNPEVVAHLIPPT